MSNHDQTAEHGGHGSESSHGSPLQYVIVWVLLLIGTFLTFTVAELPRGEWTLPIALLIATCKGTLVALFFMHLYGDKGLPKMVLLTAVTLFVLLITLLMTDLHFRFPLVTPRGVELPIPQRVLPPPFGPGTPEK